LESLRESTHQRFMVTDEADVGAARRAVKQYADQFGVTSACSGRAELAVTELATNLLYHAKPGGWILARATPPARIELIAVDHGPGIANLDAAIAGRTPSPKGLGRGLTVVRRASSYFDVHTAIGRGTIVLSVLDLDPAAQRSPPAAQRRWAGISVGVQESCGDGWAVATLDGGAAIAVVDGLGHGLRASAATDAALLAFMADPADVDGFVARANSAMRGTRGAAVAICRLDPGSAELRYVSVGNVSGRVRSRCGERGLLSYHGTLGMRAAPPKARVLTCPWQPDDVLVLWTDGLNTRVDLSADADLFNHDPAVVAAALHRDHRRDRDDATVVVVRNTGPS
jgi:anti-sigma regulatory factor (Ser/Thr protein kinase)